MFMLPSLGMGGKEMLGTNAFNFMPTFFFFFVMAMAMIRREIDLLYLYTFLLFDVHKICNLFHMMAWKSLKHECRINDKYWIYF